MNAPDVMDKPERWLKPRNHWRIVAGWALVALVLRTLFVFTCPTDPQTLAAILPDQGEYLRLARHLLAGDGLLMWDARFEQYIRAYRTPGYPLFVALLGASARGVFIAQALVGASCVVAVCLMVRALLPSGATARHGNGRGPIHVAAVFVALNPFLIYFTGTILSETLFTALLIWGMALLLGIGRMKRGTGLLAGSIVLALAVLVRPSAMWLPSLLGLAAAVMHRRSILAGMGVPALAVVIVLLPWSYRNHQLLGRWVWTTTNGGITLYDGFHPAADGSSNQDFLTSESGLLTELRAMSEVERDQFLSRRAGDYVLARPERVVELTPLKIARTWSPVPMSRQFGSSGLNVLAGSCYAIPLFALTLWGLFRSGASKSAKTFLMLPAIYFTVVHAASVGSLRYRVPADVPMAVVGAVAIARRRSNDEKQSTRA